MKSLPALRRNSTLPVSGARETRETFLHIALVGMTITVTALLGYIALRDAEDQSMGEVDQIR